MSLKSQDSKKPILLLVDGHSLAFRSFYAFSKGVDGGLTTNNYAEMELDEVLE